MRRHSRIFFPSYLDGRYLCSAVPRQKRNCGFRLPSAPSAWMYFPWTKRKLFDLFGYGRYIYTFQAACREEPDCVLQDGAFRIFLNTRGTNDNEVSPELVSFLHYLENTTDAAADSSDSERIRRIHRRVQDVKQSEQIGVKYMQAWEERYYDRKEAREEGQKEGRVEGGDLLLLEMVRKNLDKQRTCTEIADALEQPEDKIRHIIQVIESHPETDDEELLKVL